MSSSPILPSLFISHGSPTVALMEDDYTRSLRKLGRELPRPSAIVAVSAHHQTPDWTVAVNASVRPRVEYDFSGFQPELYQLEYPVAGSPELAVRLAAILGQAGFQTLIEQRGFDHGVWMPLRFLFPEADVPVVQLSMPSSSDPRLLLKLGHSLAGLRKEGILLVGSGGVVHNLHKIAWSEKYGEPYDWAREFNDWVKARVEAARVEELVSFREKAPHAELAHPHPDHFLPLLFTIGAALPGDEAYTIFNGFHYRGLSLYSFALRHREPGTGLSLN